MSKLAFVFPGQASQYVGMGKDLYEKYDLAKKYYDEANEILGIDIKGVSFEGPLEELKQTKITQPAIFVMSVILMELLKEKGITPDITAGHSLGEYAALVCSGAIKYEDALKVVALRGAAMQQAGEDNPGTMAAVIGLDNEKVAEICEQASDAGIVQAANFNGAIQTVISGSIEGVKRAMEIAKENKAKIVKELVVSGAFHSPLMESAVPKLADKLAEVTMNDAEIPVVPNVTAKPETNSAELKNLLIKQVTSPVKWTETMEQMMEFGVTNFVEVGPGKVLQGLGRRLSKDITFKGLETAEQLESFTL